MSSEYNLRGHTALVTGAGRRLGRAFAEAIGGRGGNLVVHYAHSAAEAGEVVREAERQGVRAVAVQADLADPGQAGALFERCLEVAPEIDLLVNSAAIFESVGPLESSLETWQRHLQVNLTAPFQLATAFARSRNGDAGAIVNVLDWRALHPGRDHFPYTISKAGLAALTRGLALALAPAIRVNGLALGAILPPVEGDPSDPIDRIPLARWGTEEEAVDGLLFLLAGPGSITGEILQVDGGRHLLV